MSGSIRVNIITRLKILVELSNTVFTLAFTQQVSETTTTTAEGGPAFSAAPVLYERERRANCQGEERGSWRRQERRLEGRRERKCTGRNHGRERGSEGGGEEEKEGSAFANFFTTALPPVLLTVHTALSSMLSFLLIMYSST